MSMMFNQEKPFDLIAVGRACIDLNAVEYNRPLEETMTFQKYVGGSPANIVIGMSKLGLKTGFIGKIADDQHGRFITKYFETVGVDMSQLVLDKEGHKTGLAFTEIKSPEECSILMYRDEVADLYLAPDEVSEDYIAQAKILLVSGTALSKSPSREAILTAVQLAKNHQVKVVFELDYRPYTWQSTEETAVYYTAVAQLADIVIGTRDEFNMLENKENGSNDETIAALFNYAPELIVIKHGVEGSYAYTKSGDVYKGKAYQSKVLKTFGAGDSYASAFLFALLAGKDLTTALQFGSASAAIVVSKHSSSEAMPTLAEIENLITVQTEKEVNTK
ncbi:MAG: 5-dehydro-2-deoxygluconokinase [Solibacillus sp.]